MNYRTLGIEEQLIAVHCRVELFLGSFSTMTMWDEKQQRWTNTLKEQHALLWSGVHSTRVCSRPEPRTDRNNTGGETRASFECSFIFFPRSVWVCYERRIIFILKVLREATKPPPGQLLSVRRDAFDCNTKSDFWGEKTLQTSE